MVDIRKFWPVAVYAIVVWANTDLITPVAFAMLGSSLWTVSAVAIVATIELVYGFWFWGWVVKQGPAIEALRERRRNAHHRGFSRLVLNGITDWVLEGVLKAYRKVKSPENGIRRHINRWGIIAVWLLGVNPVPGVPTRGPCCAFLGFYGFRKEFYHLMAANLLHVIIVMWGWGWLLGR